MENNKSEKNTSMVNQGGFLKTTDIPVTGLTSEQKAALNRKGNVLFNEGDIEGAKRIFITTGYSDGLTRVGDVCLADGKELDALKLYWLAHNRRKSAPILEKLAQLIEIMIEEEV